MNLQDAELMDAETIWKMSRNPRKRQRLSPDPQDYPFVFFGRPLPPLDLDVRDDGSYIPLWKQEVTAIRYEVYK
jgi:hypothetical protein